MPRRSPECKADTSFMQMFPEGVVYEGHNEGKPMYFRGESGANDSMIPLLDSLLEIPMPSNPLTAILKDFRSFVTLLLPTDLVPQADRSLVVIHTGTVRSRIVTSSRVYARKPRSSGFARTRARTLRRQCSTSDCSIMCAAFAGGTGCLRENTSSDAAVIRRRQGAVRS